MDPFLFEEGETPPSILRVVRYLDKEPECVSEFRYDGRLRFYEDASVDKTRPIVEDLEALKKVVPSNKSEVSQPVISRLLHTLDPRRGVHGDIQGPVKEYLAELMNRDPRVWPIFEDIVETYLRLGDPTLDRVAMGVRSIDMLISILGSPIQARAQAAFNELGYVFMLEGIIFNFEKYYNRKTNKKYNRGRFLTGFSYLVAKWAMENGIESTEAEIEAYISNAPYKDKGDIVETVKKHSLEFLKELDEKKLKEIDFSTVLVSKFDKILEENPDWAAPFIRDAAPMLASNVFTGLPRGPLGLELLESEKRFRKTKGLLVIDPSYFYDAGFIGIFANLCDMLAELKKQAPDRCEVGILITRFDEEVEVDKKIEEIIKALQARYRNFVGYSTFEFNPNTSNIVSVFGNNYLMIYRGNENKQIIEYKDSRFKNTFRNEVSVTQYDYVDALAIFRLHIELLNCKNEDEGRGLVYQYSESTRVLTSKSAQDSIFEEIRKIEFQQEIIKNL